MGKGYAEGPAADEAEARLDALARAKNQPSDTLSLGLGGADGKGERAAVYGSSDDEPERHFLGWLGEVDPDELFASGAAWGITVVRQRESSPV